MRVASDGAIKLNLEDFPRKKINERSTREITKFYMNLNRHKRTRAPSDQLGTCNVVSDGQQGCFNRLIAVATSSDGRTALASLCWPRGIARKQILGRDYLENTAEHEAGLT